jgi:integrase/recombinase XerD
MHAFRRAFAVNSLRNGMDVVTLQRLMGHADLSVIDRYLALLDEDLQRAHDRYGVVDNLK